MVDSLRRWVPSTADEDAFVEPLAGAFTEPLAGVFTEPLAGAFVAADTPA
ncbi:hypothetical protein [Streptomyces sp. NPDC088923]